MDATELERLRYPIGRFRRPTEPGPVDRNRWIDAIEAFPARLREAVADLEDARLDTPYRPGGWTVRQVVHHTADSHTNGWIRLSLALAENDREATLYDEAAWADQPFARNGPIAPSLGLLDGLHARWSATARGLDESRFRRSLRHPDWDTMTVDDILALYAWHGRHHTAHITSLRAREGWGG